MHVPAMDRMPTLQVRDFPDDLSRVLKARAARAGQSLSEYVLGELRVIASRPTIDELTERIAARGPVDLVRPAVEVLIEERAEARRQ